MRKGVLIFVTVFMILFISACSRTAEIKQSTHQEAMETYARAMEQGDYDTMAAIYPSGTSNEEEYQQAKKSGAKYEGNPGTFKTDGRPCYTLEFTASKMPEGFYFQADNVDYQYVLLEQNDEGKWIIYGMGTGMAYDENSFIDE